MSSFAYGDQHDMEAWFVPLQFQKYTFKVAS